MRRFLAATALGGVALFLLAACSLPEGTDGKIADDWPDPPKAESWQPQAGQCHDDAFADAPSYALQKPTECTASHVIETVHVGAFDTRETPPAEGSPERRKAYGECLAKSAEFLGDDWRAGRLWLGLAVPTNAAWSGGARWYRCDVWEVKAKDDPDEVERSASLKDGLRGNRPVGYGCYLATIKSEKVESMAAAECTKAHNAEFAGVFVAPDVAYPKTEKDRDNLAFNGCQGVIAKFANVPNDGNFKFRTGMIVTPYSQVEWELGNRGIRCHMWLEKNATRSMKGAGPGVLPAT